MQDDIAAQIILVKSALLWEPYQSKSPHGYEGIAVWEIIIRQIRTVALAFIELRL